MSTGRSILDLCLLVLLALMVGGSLLVAALGAIHAACNRVEDAVDRIVTPEPDFTRVHDDLAAARERRERAGGAA